MTDSPRADVAVIGGTGFYSFLTDATEHVVDDAVRRSVRRRSRSARWRAGRSPSSRGTAPHHDFPPHAIPYRANAWALRSLGVRQVLAPCAVGGLRDTVAPGDLVVPDQLVDRTHRRIGSYVESGAVHLPFADPYCPGVSAALAARPTPTCAAAARWSSSRGRASPPARSRSTTPRRAGT